MHLRVTFRDSSGLAVLDRAHAAATARDITLVLINVEPSVRRVLETIDMCCLLADT